MNSVIVYVDYGDIHFDIKNDDEEKEFNQDDACEENWITSSNN